MALAETRAGDSLWDMGSSMIGDSLQVWEKVSNIKAARSSSGQDQQAQMVTPQLANGSAIQVAAPIEQVGSKDDGNVVIMGAKVNKNLLLFSGGLLTLTVLMKAKLF